MVAGILLAASLTLPVCEVVERADRETKTYPGVVKAIARVDIVPQVCAEVLEVCFEDGAPVCKGDVLYRLDSVRYVAEVKNAEAELVVARDHLRHCTITAPFDGRMGTAVRRVGSFVMDDPDTWPLVDLVQTDPIRVRFALSNGDYLRMFDGDVENLRSNAVVEVILPDGRAYERQGVVEYVENVANRRTDTSPVYIRLPNSDGRLRPDGTVTVRLASARGTGRMAVPVTAVLQNVQGPYVWVVGADGKAERRQVGRGRIDGPWQFIEKGLEKGERIVADGGHKVRKGMTVIPAPFRP